MFQLQEGTLACPVDTPALVLVLLRLFGSLLKLIYEASGRVKSWSNLVIRQCHAAP